MMMTLALGIPAPEGSVTLPEILPKTACPKSVGGKAAKTTYKKTTDKESGRARKALFMAHSNRSEEHTSELQSRLHLVCRLLLEKKKRCVRSLPASVIPGSH